MGEKSNTTLMKSDDASLQAFKDESGYHIALTTKDSYKIKKVTKKTHDLLIKALAE